MSKYEVSNGEYYDFLNAIKTDPDALRTAQVYDSKWNDVLDSPTPFVNYYFSHESYRNYPVVNVSYEGALAYCKYLSTKLSEEQGKKITVKLPTTEEWLFAASGGNVEMQFGWGKTEMMNKDGYAYANFRLNNTPSNSITTPVDAYIPNAFQLYNCSGNVSEMLAEKGKAIGGNWTTGLENIQLSESLIEYSEANPTIGFRVMLVL